MPNHTTPNRSGGGRDLLKKISKKQKAMDIGKKAPMSIRVGEYGRYQIKSGLVSGVYTARAFVKPPTKCRGLLAGATGKTEETAIAALYSAIDAREFSQIKDRRTDSNTGTRIPTSDEYIEALNTIKLTKPKWAMMMALSLAKANGLTEEKIASAGRYRSTASAQKALASAGLMIAEYLSTETATKVPTTSLDGVMLIGFSSNCVNEEKPENLIMHPELRTAVRIAT
jgi:hypothetical protein